MSPQSSEGLESPKQRRPLLPGDPAPWFDAPSLTNPRFSFSTAAGRVVLLFFFGSAENAGGKELLTSFLRHGDLFSNPKTYLLGISADPADRNRRIVTERRPGVEFFWDLDGRIAGLFGVSSCGNSLAGYKPVTFVLDESLRVTNVFLGTPKEQAESAINIIRSVPRPTPKLAATPVPVLLLPRVFERSLCDILIKAFEAGEHSKSGFMQEKEGKTTQVEDPRFKKRRDLSIQDEGLRAAIQQRIRRRLVPEIQKVFQFRATRTERYVVARYDAETGGYFRAHRDNTTKGTAHRRFAVTINLNEEAYAGGELVFPEFGDGYYRPPTGSALVFSCSLLHEVRPVTQGKRYAFLPFLYGEEDAQLREANSQHLEVGLAHYRA